MKPRSLLATLTGILVAVLILSIAGKVVRSVALQQNSVRYFSVDIEGNDLDLAIRITPDEIAHIHRKDRVAWLQGIREQVTHGTKPKTDVHRLEDLELLIDQLEKEENKRREFADAPIEYWDKSEGKAFWGAIKQRVDDISFINTLGVLVFAALLLNFTSGGGRQGGEPLFSDYLIRPRKSTWRAWFVLAAAIAVYGLVPQTAHLLGDHGPIHGTFWTEDFIFAVTATQWLDGILFVVSGAVCGAILILYAAMLQRFKAELRPDNIKRYNQLIQTPLYPLALIALVVAFIAQDPWLWDFHTIAANHIVFMSSLYLSFVGVSLGVGFSRLPDGFYRDVSISSEGLFALRVACASQRRTSLQAKAPRRERRLATEGRTRPPSCFVSYSHEDETFVRQLHDELEARGIACWLDEHELEVGDRIMLEVNDAIRRHDKVLLCCSSASLNSVWVERELRTVLDKELTQRSLLLLPLDLDRYVFDEYEGEFSAELRSRVVADFTELEGDAGEQKFEEQVERVVEALDVSRKV